MKKKEPSTYYSTAAVGAQSDPSPPLPNLNQKNNKGKILVNINKKNE